MKCVFLLVLILLSVGVVAQELGPETSVLGKTTFGINGLAVLDVALPTEVSYNPAAFAWAMDAFKEKGYAEADFGILKFEAGPTVKNDWEVAAIATPQGALRFSRYGVDSNSKEIAFLGPGPEVSFRGQTAEFAYGRKISPKLFAGVAIIPYEEIKTKVTFDGVDLARAKASSHQHGRLGILYLPTDKVSIGLVYTSDKMRAKTNLLPVLTDKMMPIEMSAHYREELWTAGIAYQPIQGTALYFDWQKGKIRGPNVSEKIDLKVMGIKQFVNQRLCLFVERNDKVLGYGLNYFGRNWNAGASVSNDTYRRTEEFFGRADTLYVWAGKNW